MKKSKLAVKFEQAKQDLGLDVVAPFDLTIDGDTTLRAEVLLRNFGGKNGTLIFSSTASFWPYQVQIVNLGYGFSTLSEPGNDDSYDREELIEMLSEWGWTGDESKKPNWV